MAVVRKRGLGRWLLAGLVLLTLLAPGAGRALAQSRGEGSPARGEAVRTFRGMPLRAALRELEAQGLRIVFTTQLVRSGMRVRAEPAATEPRDILDEILAPHGLRADERVGGTLVIVAAEGPVHRVSIAGVVRSRESHEPVGGAVIRVVEPGLEVVSAADGRFQTGELAPGLYTLEARCRGFVVEQAGEVAVARGETAAVNLLLQPAPFVHDEIVVRPSQLSLLQEEPAAPLSLSRGEIESLPQLGGDVFRALSLLPGAAANDITAQFHVHGGRRDEVEVLLDGQELYEAYHLKDFDNALSIVPAVGLSKVSLSTGAFPANHGDRMSGVLDLTTETPTRKRSTALSFSLLNAVGATGGTFEEEKGSWFASGRRGSIDLASRVFGREDPAFWDLFGKVELQLPAYGSLRAHALYAGDRLDFRETVGGESKRLDTAYDSSYLWLTHQAALGERLLVETSLSQTRIERDRRGVEDEEEQSLEVMDRRLLEVSGLRQSWTFQARPGHLLTGGFHLRRYDADFTYFNQAEPDFVLVSDLAEPRDGIPLFAGSFRGEHLGAWVTERFSPLAALTVELGLRYDRHQLTGDTLWSPRLNLAWRIGESSVLRGAWGHFHQSQRPYELGVEDGETAFEPAERSEHWVLGYERLLGRGERAPLQALRVELYRREIRDPRPRYENLFEPINTFPEVERDRVRIVPERSRADGFELVVRGAAGKAADWWLTYAYATIDDRLQGQEIPRQTDQTHTVNTQLNLRLGPRWSLNLAWRYRTGWPTSPVALEERLDDDGEVELVPVLGRLNSQRLPIYHRLDVRASRRWKTRSGELDFFIDIQNLYNRKNLAGFDLAIDEDEARLVLEAETWSGFFPSIGISWEF